MVVHSRRSLFDPLRDKASKMARLLSIWRNGTHNEDSDQTEHRPKLISLATERKWNIVVFFAHVAVYFALNRNKRKKKLYKNVNTPLLCVKTSNFQMKSAIVFYFRKLQT